MCVNWTATVTFQWQQKHKNYLMCWVLQYRRILDRITYKVSARWRCSYNASFKAIISVQSSLAYCPLSIYNPFKLQYKTTYKLRWSFYGGIFLPSLVRLLCRLVRSLCWLVSYLCCLVRKISPQLVAKYLIFISR